MTTLVDEPVDEPAVHVEHTPTPAARVRRTRPVDDSRVGHQSPAGLILGGYLPLFLATMIIALPLLWMVLGSLKTGGEVVNQNIVWLPRTPTLAAFQTASAQVSFPRLFLNSLIVTAAGSIIKLALAVTTAYALVFVKFPFKNAIFLGILVALMVPSQVSLLPNYILIAGMGGINTYWGIILPGLGTAFGTFLLRQHFRSLPIELMEAAEIDGAGHLRRLMRIVLPISGPTLVTVALVIIVDEWNNYIWPLIITSNDTMMTLPVGLTLLQNVEADPSSYPVLMAGSVVVILPVLIIFIFLQRYIVAGLTQGAIK